MKHVNNIFGLNLYWLFSALFLLAGVLNCPIGFQSAVLVSAVNLCHMIIKQHSVTVFPVQVRFAYLGLLLLGLIPGWQVLYWLPLVGTTALLVFDYCLLARVLSLMPWNRAYKISYVDVYNTFISPPTAGCFALSK
jgi:hypothetical protein